MMGLLGFGEGSMEETDVLGWLQERKKEIGHWIHTRKEKAFPVEREGGEK